MSAATEISETTVARVAMFANLSSRIEYTIAGEQWMDAVRNLGAIALVFQELAADAAQEAFNDGATKKAIADALGVTPATFRGMERTR